MAVTLLFRCISNVKTIVSETLILDWHELESTMLKHSIWDRRIYCVDSYVFIIRNSYCPVLETLQPDQSGTSCLKSRINNRLNPTANHSTAVDSPAPLPPRALLITCLRINFSADNNRLHQKNQLTFQRLALNEIEVIGLAQNSGSKSANESFQISMVDVEIQRRAHFHRYSGRLLSLSLSTTSYIWRPNATANHSQLPIAEMGWLYHVTNSYGAPLTQSWLKIINQSINFYSATI